MMFYEVFIPAHQDDAFDVTITVEAENWMLALKSGLERTGEGADIRNVMCDIKEDNTIHVTDATTRRVFVLKEVEDLDLELIEASEADFATQKMSALPPSLPPQEETQAPASREAVEEATESAATFGGRKSTTQRHHQPPPAAQSPPPAAEQPEASPAPERVTRPPERRVEPAPVAPVESMPTPKAAAPAPTPSAPEPAPSAPEPEETTAEPGQGESWTSDDGRMRIGSSTFEALRRDEPEPKVVRETRALSGTRPAVDIGRAKESVSQSALEEVFLEIQQIHEQQMSMEQVINYVMDLCMQKIDSEAGSIMFADVNGRELYFATARGPKAHAVMDFRVPMTMGLVGFCAREGVSIAISDAEKDPRFYKAISDALGYETQNLCCAPVQFEGRVYGCIELLNKSKPFSNTEVNLLTYVGTQLAKFVHDLIMSREKLE